MKHADPVAARAQHRLDHLTKPQGALGRRCASRS